ncbi:MAG: NAD-dependent epimerase/dehydratase family protein [Candidatus Eremiobacteraeota bacterium]|nr:NAD-dependent epimerase/dehydratase family protein [Candidatus Eremiobacteraeota bacterium]
MKRHLVTGCAGFVGSTIVDRLVRDGHDVIGIDNFSTGREEFLIDASRTGAFRLIRGDLVDPEVTLRAMPGVDTVFHIAANADVRFGTDHPTRDFEQNTRVTLNVLEAMRAHDVRRIVFSSTGSIYADTTEIPTPEDAPLPLQTSVYGASKIAAESFIQAYSEGFGIQSFIFRFVSLLGDRYTHGHVVDFYRQLREHPDRLHVLGDGKQRKSYLFVGDCVDAIMHVIATSQNRIDVFNLGTDEYCEVDDSIGWIVAALDARPTITYSGGRQGWIGDNPFIFLDTKKILATGWRPTLTIRQAVERTIRYLSERENAPV